MASYYIRQRPATWFMPVALLALIWGLVGCYAFYVQTFGPPKGSSYDQELLASLPRWFDVVYGIAALGGLMGAVALMRRSAWARPLFVVSLAAVIVQFAYVFLATDVIAVKGLWTVVLPLIIAGVTGAEIWFSQYSRRRGWIA